MANIKIKARLDKMSAELEKVRKHVEAYSGISDKDATAVRWRCADIIRDASALLAQADKVGAPEASTERYTREPGRHIHRDGKPFVYVGRVEASHGGTASPVEADDISWQIVALLNGGSK